MASAQKRTELSSEQTDALNNLKSGENIFLTGGAGSGKSFVIQAFLKTTDPKSFPILASTGAAAVLLGGRTFHSFFGLGIMDGGADATFERCLRDSKLLQRIKKVEGFVIDEISMIPGSVLMVAEALAQRARDSELPWGGLQVIAVGDFAQLPPVTRVTPSSSYELAPVGRDWAFKNHVWKQTHFQNIVLKTNQRVQDQEYIEILQQVRFGQVNQDVTDFLNGAIREHDEDDSGTRLFPRRDQSEQYNFKKLKDIHEDEFVSDTIYIGQERAIESLKRSCPVNDQLKLKLGCHVLFLQNDTQKRWVNGTQGIVTSIDVHQIKVKKMDMQKASRRKKNDNDETPMHSREVTVDKTSFALQDAEGKIIAQAIQFPLALGYATTIHKSQGATLDELWCDLGSLWEPGQAYVAMSRLRSRQGLKILRLNTRSIIVDRQVVEFYNRLD
ncbi:MAG: DEAD/DEAH box helicase [Pseudobdellovibrionaceae bacterium]